MTRAWRWAAAAALIAAAWVVALVTPPEDSPTDPYPVPMQVGETATGRDLSVRVREVVVAEGVSAPRWKAEGPWVVVDLDAAFVDGRDSVMLAHAELVVDGLRFRASERPRSLAREPLVAGVPLSGSLAFELPPALLERAAVLRLATSDDIRADSILELPLELGALPRESDVELEETRWAP